MKTDSAQRIEDLITRLSDRGRWTWAARIYGAWLADLSPTPLQLWRYGRLLTKANDNARATDAFRELAGRMSQPAASPLFLLQRSFDEWARCLQLAGLFKSAEETREMGARICARRAAEDDEQHISLTPSRLLLPIASRCTFSLSLEWERKAGAFQVIEEDGFLMLRDRFKLADPPATWFEFECKTPAEPHPQYPHVAVCVTLPWRFSGPGAIAAALALVNEMNLENAAASACLLPESGRLAVRSRLAFAGFNEGVAPLTDIAGAQEEATLNMVLEVVGMAAEWERRVAALSYRLRVQR
jgi:hypothetical protein